MSDQGQGTPKAGCYRTPAVLAVLVAIVVAFLLDCGWD